MIGCPGSAFGVRRMPKPPLHSGLRVVNLNLRQPLRAMACAIVLAVCPIGLDDQSLPIGTTDRGAPTSWQRAGPSDEECCRGTEPCRRRAAAIRCCRWVQSKPRWRRSSDQTHASRPAVIRLIALSSDSCRSWRMALVISGASKLRRNTWVNHEGLSLASTARPCIDRPLPVMTRSLRCRARVMSRCTLRKKRTAALHNASR